MASNSEQIRSISRRDAIRRVSLLLGGVAFVGGSRLLAALEKTDRPAGSTVGEFSAQDIAFLDEIAETILPETKTPGAKAAKTGAFMALMVTDSYWPDEQKVFRAGMHRIDEAMKKTHDVSFMQATPAQRTALLTRLDHEQKRVMDAYEAAQRKRKGLAPLPADETVPKAKADPNLQAGQVESMPAAAASDTEDPHERSAHYFRMMKELALLGYFTSEIGCTQATRYVETPGRFDPCIPYSAGETAWASHA